MTKAYIVKHSWWICDRNDSHRYEDVPKVFESREIAEAYIMQVYGRLSWLYYVYGAFYEFGKTGCDLRRINDHCDRECETWTVFECPTINDLDDLKRMIEL